MSNAYRLLAPRPMAARVLVLYPFAGAGAHIFRNWLDHLPRDIEPWALQLPGREDRLGEVPLTDWPQAVALAHDGLAGLAAGRPVTLYGHSLGALLALAVAEAAKPAALDRVIIGAPPRRERLPKGDDVLAALEDAYGPLPSSLADPDIRDATLPALTADLSLLSAAPTKMRTPDMMLLGEDDPSSPAAREAFPDVMTKDIPGGHYFCQTYPRETIAAIFR